MPEQFVRLNTAGHLSILYAFNEHNGTAPNGKVVGDQAGNLYGTALSGGTDNDGVVFEIDSAGTGKVLYTFTGGADGQNPLAGVILDPAGNLYGTTEYGGTTAGGVIFKLTPQ